jgi:branched-subunit amino acid ABC-type transport system permease component
MFVTLLDIVIAGLLMGGIYALIAVGLSLQYGVARVLNIAHGEFIMLGAFITWSLYTFFGLVPLISLAISGPCNLHNRVHPLQNPVHAPQNRFAVTGCL